VHCMFSRIVVYFARFTASLLAEFILGSFRIFNSWVDAHWPTIGNLPYISSINNSEDEAYVLVLLVMDSIILIPLIIVAECLIRKVIRKHKIRHQL